VYCWWTSCKIVQQSMQHHTAQPKNGYQQRLNDTAQNCSQHVFSFCTRTRAALQVDNLGTSAIQPKLEPRF
jgi:hypothetical protein